MRFLATAMLTGCLTLESFEERVIEKKCEEDARCATAGMQGDCALFRVPAANLCNFDRAAAERCLRDDWVCNTQQPGFEFAEPPAACDAVCVQAVDQEHSR